MTNKIIPNSPIQKPILPQQAPLEKFNPTTQPPKEPPVRPNGTSTSISAIIAEATDGDAQEASNLAKLGKAKQDGLKEGNEEQINEVKTHAPAAVSWKEHSDNNQSNFMDDAADRAEAQTKNISNINALEAAKSTKGQTAETITASHDQLMLMTGSMAREEIANHVNQQFAGALSEILKTPIWHRDPSGIDKISAAQMEIINAGTSR